jgi:predicted ATPase
VGRQTALAQLQSSLQSNSRLVTLTGPVGVGKSRLAWAAAENICQLGAFEDVVFCNIDGIDSEDACQDALHRAIGSTPRRSQPFEKSLDSLGQALLVLDGFDGLPASIVAGWLGVAPSIKCFVTTRRRLDLAGETIHELGPLDLADGQDLRGEAADFFLQCVARVRPGYAPTPAETPFVVELIRELDGLPLALQLAAPRLTVMGPAVLLHRLRTSRSVLRANSQDSPTHLSFDAAMESAWQALSAQEREVLTQLTVFSGSLTSEAAEHVVSTRGAAVIDVLQALRQRSMLLTETGDDGTVRLRMLRGVRSFVTRHGDPAVQNEARGRHAEYFAHQAIQWGHAAVGSEAHTWFTQERDNLLQVLRGVSHAQGVTARSAEPALHVALALDPFHCTSAPSHELSALLETALEASRDSGANPLLFARALALRGSIRRVRGHVPAATKDLLQSLHVGTNLGCADLQGRALLEIGRILLQRDEIEPARDHFHKALDAFRTAGARAEEAAALQALAETEALEGRLEDAMALVDRAVALLTRSQEPEAEAAARCALARASIHAGDASRAAQQVQAVRALPLRRDEPARLQADLLEAVSLNDADKEPDCASYVAVENAARHASLASLEAETLAFQAVARAQQGAFGESHALFRAAFDVHPHFPNASLWSAIAAALDARTAPSVSTIPPPAEHASDSSPVHAAILALRRLASAPSTWSEERRHLIALSSRDVVVRFAVRALDRTATVASRPALPLDALVVGEAGRWFRMPGEKVVSLERRRPLAFLLDRLVTSRRQDALAALPWDVLQEAGWPGERIMAEAGAHRVRVAISTLRKLGLKDALETTPEGYRLSETLPVVRVEGASEG